MILRSDMCRACYKQADSHWLCHFQDVRVLVFVVVPYASRGGHGEVGVGDAVLLVGLFLAVSLHACGSASVFRPSPGAQSGVRFSVRWHAAEQLCAAQFACVVV